MILPACRFLSIVLLLYSSRGWCQSNDQGFKFYRQSLDKSVPFQETIKGGEKALSFSKKTGNDSLMNLAHIQLGILYWHDGQFDRAWDHLTQGQRLALQKKDLFKAAQCFHYKGLVQYYKCNFDSALFWYRLAEQEFDRLGVDSALAKLKSHKALIYSATGRYKPAIQNMLESFRLQESSPGYRDMTIPIQFFGPSDESLYYKSKLEKDLESLQFVESTKDRSRIAFTVFNIGLDYYHLKSYNKALGFFKRNSALFASLGYPSFKGNIADAFVALGNYDSAIYYFDSWMKELRERGTRIHLAAAYMNVAACYRAQKKWNEALHYFELSQSLNKRIGLLRSEAVVDRAKAQIHLELGQASVALQEINSGISIAKQIGCISDIQAFLKLRSDILNRLKRYEEATDDLRQSFVLHDSIQAGEGQLQVARLQIEYETEKKSRDLAQLQSLNKLNEAQITTRNLQIALAFSLLTIASIAGGFFFYRYWQKKESSELLFKQNEKIEIQNQTLQLQNSEKEILLSEIHHRVKNNLQIISSLINLKANHARDETKETLQQLNGRIFSMGLIHEKLYQEQNIHVIRLDLYLTEVGNYLLQSFTNTESAVQFEVKGDPVEIDADKALSCGLICNELMTNSLKYAFADSQNERMIKMTLRKTIEFVELEVSDNGLKRLPSEEIKKSFGLRFTDQLISSKLKGTWSYWFDKGFHVGIRLPLSVNGKN